MIIRDILKAKGGAIFSIAPGAAASEALGLMVKNDIGSLVVMEGAQLGGMLSFRELLKALDANKGNLAGIKVKDVMIRDPACGNPEDSLESLRELMNRYHIRYLPVRGRPAARVYALSTSPTRIKENHVHTPAQSYIKNGPVKQFGY